MEEIELNSCSFSSEHEETASVSSVKAKQTDAEVTHLKSVNQQLQNSIDNLRQQLKDALSAVDSIGSMNETICQLKDDLEKAKETEKEQRKEMQRIQSECNDKVGKLSSDLESLTQKSEEMEESLKAEKEHVSKLKKDKQTLKAECKEKGTIVENLAIELKQALSSKKKLRAKLIGVAEELEKKNEENKKLSLSAQERENEKNCLTQEIDALKVKLVQRDVSVEEGRLAVNKLQGELRQNKTAIESLRDQLDSQNEEMDEMSEERQNCLLLIQKMYSTFTFAEQKLESLKKENETLKLKLQKTGKNAKVGSAYDVSTITLPFEGDIGERAIQINQLPQYQPVQRMQIIINETAKTIKELEEKTQSQEMEIVSLNSRLEQAMDGQTPYCQILDALLKELKDISCQEAQINNANLCRVDTQFIEFMAQKSAEIEPLIKDELLKDPRFIPSDFFTTPDVEKKNEYIKEIINCSDVSYTIFTAQFLISRILTKQLKELMGPLGKMEEISRLDVVGGDFNDIPNLLLQLQTKINNLKKTRSQLHAHLKKQTEVANNAIESESKYKTLVSQLQIENDSLKSENEVLKVKNQVATNELLLRKNEDNINAFASQIRESVAEQQNEARQRTDRLEEELRQKETENADLSALIKKLHESLKDASKKQSKRFQKTEDALKEQISDMEQQLEMMQKELISKKKSAKRNERSLREQYEESLAAATNNYEESKSLLQKTIEDLKSKAAEARDTSKKLQQSVVDAETKNAELLENNSALENEKKQLNAQITTIKQQANKEKQNIQVQLAAQIMSCEGKITSAKQEVKDQYEKQIKELFEAIADSIGSFYAIDDCDFNEESLKQVLSRVREDLDRLQYFQNEATK